MTTETKAKEPSSGESMPPNRLAKAEELLANLYELHDFFFTADKAEKKVSGGPMGVSAHVFAAVVVVVLLLLVIAVVARVVTVVVATAVAAVVLVIITVSRGDE